MTVDDATRTGPGFDRPRPVPANLVPDLNHVNAFTTDAIVSGVVDSFAPWSRERATTLGAQVWHPRTLKAARDAQRHVPELRTLDRVGDEVHEVDFHPAYHELMSLAFGSGVHALAWTSAEPGAHTARAALSYLWNQVDGSTACPTGMAYASIPILRSYGVDPLWFSVVFLVTLQTSYLSPPMAPSIFYLRSIAPPEMKLAQMYKGVIPFICCQIVVLTLLFLFPELATWLPKVIYG